MRPKNNGPTPARANVFIDGKHRRGVWFVGERKACLPKRLPMIRIPPYSASKASSDHFVRAYGETYGLPYVLTNCSNNYGPNHFPEKLIPLFINNIINNKPLPVYGDGNYTRDWLFVKDHAVAIDLVFHQGQNHETYNIGGFNEWKNIDLVKVLCQIIGHEIGKNCRRIGKVDHLRERPTRTRFALCHRCQQNQPGIGMATFGHFRTRSGNHYRLVLEQPGMVEQRNFRGLREVLREDVFLV